MGATIIKLEIPGKGDDSRKYGPYINGESAYYANLNRNKMGITLNLKHPIGKQLFLKLVKKVDILIENFRPGVMEKLGFGYERLRLVNEMLIYGAISGFGSYGPYSQRAGYDIISQAMGGLMSITGPQDSEPTRSGNAMGDILGGLNLTIGLLAALNARKIIGHGQRVDVSLVDSVVSSLENAFIRYSESGQLPERMGNRYAAIAPYDSFKAQDGYVIIACGNQKLFEILCNEMLKKPEMITDDRFTTIQDRLENIDVLKEHIEAWTKQYTVKEIVDLALEKGIPASPIYNLKQILEDEHIAKVREMFVDIDHPAIGRLKITGSPIKLMETMPQIKRPSPTLGQHNAEVYMGMLELTSQELEEYKNQGII